MTRYSAATDALEKAFVKSTPSDARKPPTQADWASALERFNQDARSIRVTYRLGVIGRAVVAYRLQKRLVSSGYPTVVVRQLLFAMILSAFIG